MFHTRLISGCVEQNMVQRREIEIGVGKKRRQPNKHICVVSFSALFWGLLQRENIAPLISVSSHAHEGDKPAILLIRTAQPDNRDGLTCGKHSVNFFINRCQVIGWPLHSFLQSRSRTLNDSPNCKRWASILNI